MNVKRAQTTSESTLLKQSSPSAYSVIKNYKKIIKEYKMTKDSSKYKPVIDFLKQRPPPSKLYCQWLSQLSNEARILDKDTEEIIMDTLKIDWHYGDNEIEAQVLTFVSSLITAHNYFASPILEYLFTKLIPVITEKDSEELRLNPLYMSEEQRLANYKIVKVIHTITKHVPLCDELLIKIASNASPYFKRHTHMHVIFTYTLLQLKNLLPHLRKLFLDIIFNNLILMDQYSPRDELDDESDVESDDGSEDLFSMEVDSENVDPKRSTTKHPIGHTLDSLITLMFRYIHFTAHGGHGLEHILDASTGDDKHFTTNGCRAGVPCVEGPPRNVIKSGRRNSGEALPTNYDVMKNGRSKDETPPLLQLGVNGFPETPRSTRFKRRELVESPPRSTFGRGKLVEAPPTNGCECSGKNLDVDALKNLYLDVKETFSKLILPTPSSAHPQFLIFYLLSLRPALISDFLDFLYNIFNSPGNAPERRKIAVSCLGSLLARAKFIQFSHVHICLGLLRKWCKNYMESEHALSNQYEDLRLHHQFYCACQTIFYIFTFKYKAYTLSAERLEKASSLHLQELVVSPLNPLRFCNQTICLNFAAVTWHYQLAYCYSILQKNCRVFLPVAMQNSFGMFEIEQQALDAIFPFDPYLLKRSDSFICENYQEFEGLPEDILRHSINLSCKNKTDLKEEKVDEMDDEDIFGTTPETLRFSYKFSPGFKNF